MAGIDDCRGLSRNLLGTDKVLDVLRDNDLHTVVLTDTLGELEHEVQRHRELRVDEHMRLVDHHHDLALAVILRIVIAVLDDFIVNVLEHQQHLRVGDRRVAVGKQTLEIEDREVFIRRNGGRPVPDVCVAPAGGKLLYIVQKRAQHGADIVVIRRLELGENCVVQIVEGRVILRTQL